MSLFSLIVALLIEQARPLSSRAFVFGPLSAYADFLESRFNAGEQRHGTMAWFVGVLPPALAVGVVYFLLANVSVFLGLAWNILVLYFTMGFRQFSHYYTDIHLALREGNLVQARQLLGEWRGQSADGLTESEIARLAIEQAIVASHRHVFAVVVWFVLLPGPAGAVLYRLASFLDEYWGKRSHPDFGSFGEFSRTAFAWVDWLPLRLTAGAFAIVGDFEDAAYCWRVQAAKWHDPQLGIILAAGAGAIGVRLGMPYVDRGEIEDRPELGVGEDADVDFMQSAVGLVWRALVLWLLLLLLLGLASLVGS